MKLVSVTLKNFRSYKEPIEIKVQELTCLIGKNDVGKSTVLEALDVFLMMKLINKICQLILMNKLLRLVVNLIIFQKILF